MISWVMGGRAREPRKLGGIGDQHGGVITTECDMDDFQSLLRGEGHIPVNVAGTHVKKEEKKIAPGNNRSETREKTREKKTKRTHRWDSGPRGENYRSVRKFKESGTFMLVPKPVMAFRDIKRYTIGSLGSDPSHEKMSSRGKVTTFFHGILGR